MDTPTRCCARCEERKTVRGIWYLVATSAGDEPSFFCEACYQGKPSLVRPEVPASMPMGPGVVAADLPMPGDGLTPP